MGVWEFISSPENRETLAWIGGGLCIVVSALWAAFLKLRAPRSSGPPPKPQATRSATARDGIAAAGNVTAGGDVTVNTSQLPTGVYVLGGLGLAAIVFAILFAGDSTSISNSSVVGGDVTNSTITTGQ